MARPVVRVRTMATAMKISASVIAALVSECWVIQVASDWLNQWVEPYENGARAPITTAHRAA
jgi:hypothetical protein